MRDFSKRLRQLRPMWSHRRRQHKLKSQEKEDKVRQLAIDRAELKDKLSKLQGLATNLVSGRSKYSENEIIINNKLTEESVDIEEKKKILELLSEIDTESNQIIARCEISEPWFWENSQAKVMTV
mgnify:CR=1 FL=1